MRVGYSHSGHQQRKRLRTQRLGRTVVKAVKRWAWLGIAQVAIALSPHLARPTTAAETITFSFGPIERSLSVESLEIFVEEGRVTEDLAPYIRYAEDFDPALPEQIRGLLSQRVDTDVVTVAQFAYTPQGEYVLEQAGDVFRTGARLPGGQGLRAAAILSAADEAEGLTLINVINRFPTPMLRVNIRQGLAIARQATEAVNRSRQALDFISEISFESATVPFPAGVSAAELNDLVSRPGPYQARKLSLRVKSSPQFVDVYLPSRSFLSVVPDATNAPAVIISHGLGNDRETYAYLARFLAEHGFAVIAVEHAGSSADQFDALVAGRADRVVPDTEFINRPLLISNVLDELQARSQSDKNLSNIDFNNVGIIGQSFGGYTAFAVAGAPVNFESLRNTCPPEIVFNPSILLQCQALDIAPPDVLATNFRDPRIQAVFAINPMDSAILGPDSLGQIEVPVFMVAGSADTVAPALPEQVFPFTWLSDIDRYLLVMEGGTHFSTLGISGRETFDLPPQVIGPNPEIAQRYTRQMSLAFLRVYLFGDERYRPILSSAFTTRISEPDIPLSFVTGLAQENIEDSLRSSDSAIRALEDAIARELERLTGSPNID